MKGRGASGTGIGAAAARIRAGGSAALAVEGGLRDGRAEGATNSDPFGQGTVAITAVVMHRPAARTMRRSGVMDPDRRFPNARSPPFGVCRIA